ncbi:DEAD/DEAH box helicase [Thiohalocapsa marina]|uniref:ATP-dependent RNA helicase DeaD n=1 Tax=Thiohalocapsa marina TaxID=424902 RepID=A0A5M8FM46_9GAMM|nr:DEAD/DEAH box helicase [Thiohalocapsa marina]KAA6185807.1 DEAD/DEAH box helicase [Thiohalocapsa marina]
MPEQVPSTDHPVTPDSTATTTDTLPTDASGRTSTPSSVQTPALSADQASDQPSDQIGRPDNASFTTIGLAPAVARAVAELGYEAPTPVQAGCIPHLLAGRDLLGQAQTGTGKTAAFALPLLSRIDTAQELPQLLVLTPTRELALQVAEAMQRYAQHLPNFHVVPIYGGQSYTLQIRQLKHHPHVIVGTPGRVMDHMRRGTLLLTGLQAMVLDEADEMLNMGFAEDIDWIFDHAPATRQVALFSATMPDAILRVARTRLQEPVEVRVEGGTRPLATIDQQHIVVTRFHKLDVLTRILEIEPFDGMVIFVRTKHATTELADKLKAHGFTAEALHGDMTQEMRERTLERIRSGRLDIVVATDVAARGIDVERITHVVNFDIPTDPQTYVHRIGRTGRAGRSGRAILLVEPRERGLLRAIERTIGARVARMEPPSAEELSSSRIERFTADLRRTLAEQDLDFHYRVVSDLAGDLELEPLDIAAALAFQLQRERPLEVEELPAPPQRPERRPDRHQRRDRNDDRPRSARDSGDRFRHDRFRAERGERDRRAFDDRRDDRRPRRDDGAAPLASYRIEVGHDHGVSPREIVGAIANEAGIQGRNIGRIDIRGDHSIVDLPDGMPKETFQHLKRVYVRGQALRISFLGKADDQRRPPRRFQAPKDDFGARAKGSRSGEGRFDDRSRTAGRQDSRDRRRGPKRHDD